MKNIIILVCLLFSCQPEDVKKLSSELEIGQEYNNGLIFYIFKETDPEYIEGEQHGYIVSNYIGEYQWGCQDITLDQFNVQGEYNTQVIIYYCGQYTAAWQCYDNGWWLPSLEEWELLIASNVLIMPPLSSYYWTSTKASYTDAYCIRPSDGDVKQ